MLKKNLFALILITTSQLGVVAQTTWTQIENPETDNIFTSNVIPVEGSLYGGVKGIGLHRSDDGGQNWTEITSGHYKPDWGNARLLGTGNNLVFSAVYNRSYKSSDKGAKWTNISQNSDHVTHIFQMSDYVFLLSTEGYIYRSDDGGASWTEKINGLPDPDDQNPANFYTYTIMGNTLFVGEYGGTIYRTTDFGETWSATASILQDLPT